MPMGDFLSGYYPPGGGGRATVALPAGPSSAVRSAGACTGNVLVIPGGESSAMAEDLPVISTSAWHTIV